MELIKLLNFRWCTHLLKSKKDSAYSKVYEVIFSEAQKFEINTIKPQFVMTNFEQSILNATKKIIGVTRRITKSV